MKRPGLEQGTKTKQKTRKAMTPQCRREEGHLRFKVAFSVQGGFCRRKKRGEDGKIGKKLSDHKLNRHSDAEWMHLKRLDDGKLFIGPLLKSVNLPV